MSTLIRSALNIGALPELSIWAGWRLDPELPILLVLDQDAALDKVVPLFLRSGFTTFAGYLTGGMKADLLCRQHFGRLGLRIGFDPPDRNVDPGAS